MHKVIQGQKLAWCGNLKRTFSSAISVNYLQMLFEDLTSDDVVAQSFVQDSKMESRISQADRI